MRDYLGNEMHPGVVHLGPGEKLDVGQFVGKTVRVTVETNRPRRLQNREHTETKILAQFETVIKEQVLELEEFKNIPNMSVYIRELP